MIYWIGIMLNKKMPIKVDFLASAVQIYKSVLRLTLIKCFKFSPAKNGNFAQKDL